MAISTLALIQLYKQQAGNLFKFQLNESVKNVSTKCKYYTLLLNLEKPKQLTLKFENQICSSSAKPPPKTDQINNLQLAFSKLTTEDLNKTDYKQSDYPDLLEYNQEFIQALEIVDKEYKIACEKLIQTTDLKNKSINTIVQESAESIKLANPIYRLKIPVTKNWLESFGKNILFEDVNLIKCNVKQATEKITRYSLLTGYVTFDSIIVSNFGLSLGNKIIRISPMTHRIIDSLEIEKPKFTFQQNAKSTPSNRNTRGKVIKEQKKIEFDNDLVNTHSDFDNDN